jgi:hypothetical protein
MRDIDTWAWVFLGWVCGAALLGLILAWLVLSSGSFSWFPKKKKTKSWRDGA